MTGVKRARRGEAKASAIDYPYRHGKRCATCRFLARGNRCRRFGLVITDLKSRAETCGCFKWEGKKTEVKRDGSEK